MATGIVAGLSKLGVFNSAVLHRRVAAHQLELGTTAPPTGRGAGQDMRHGAVRSPQVVAATQAFFCQRPLRTLFHRYSPSVELTGAFGGRLNISPKRDSTLRNCQPRVKPGVSQSASISTSCLILGALTTGRTPSNRHGHVYRLYYEQRGECTEVWLLVTRKARVLLFSIGNC